MRLEHRDLPEAAARQHREGWLHYLDRLATAGADGDPGSDPWLEAAMNEAASP